MKTKFQRILFVLCTCISFTASGQIIKSSDKTLNPELIRNDPDWQIILNSNTDFFNRLLMQEQDLSRLWALGQETMVEQLGYSVYEYNQKHIEVKEAANRLLKKYPALNMAECNTCRQTESEVIARIDNMVNYLRANNTFDASRALREIDNGGDDTGPKCGWQFYACVTVCAASIEFFPAYLACCFICLCEYCKNPPKLCNAIL